MADSTIHLRTCPTCGLAQTVDDVPPRHRACCRRCRSTLIRSSTVRRSSQRTVAIAAAALILYPLAILLPIVRVEQLGYVRTNSVLSGIASLFSVGDVVIGLVVLVCSVVLPLAKLGGLLALSAGGAGLTHRHRALTYRLVEATGRWGMLDVLLVAALVAAVKLGDLVEITPGPGAVAFAAVVVLSLLASASFSPHMLWPTSDQEQPA